MGTAGDECIWSVVWYCCSLVHQYCNLLIGDSRLCSVAALCLDSRLLFHHLPDLRGTVVVACRDFAVNLCRFGAHTHETFRCRQARLVCSCKADRRHTQCWQGYSAIISTGIYLTDGIVCNQRLSSSYLYLIFSYLPYFNALILNVTAL